MVVINLWGRWWDGSGGRNMWACTTWAVGPLQAFGTKLAFKHRRPTLCLTVCGRLRPALT